MRPITPKKAVGGALRRAGGRYPRCLGIAPKAGLTPVQTELLRFQSARRLSQPRRQSILTSIIVCRGQAGSGLPPQKGTSDGRSLPPVKRRMPFFHGNERPPTSRGDLAPRFERSLDDSAIALELRHLGPQVHRHIIGVGCRSFTWKSAVTVHGGLSAPCAFIRW